MINLSSSNPQILCLLAPASSLHGTVFLNLKAGAGRSYMIAKVCGFVLGTKGWGIVVAVAEFGSICHLKGLRGQQLKVIPAKQQPVMTCLDSNSKFFGLKDITCSYTFSPAESILEMYWNCMKTASGIVNLSGTGSLWCRRGSRAWKTQLSEIGVQVRMFWAVSLTNHLCLSCSKPFESCRKARYV